MRNNCVLHNKMGNDFQVGNSEIGNNGTWTGSSTYASVKFNNGAYSNSTDRINFTNPAEGEAGCIGGWITMDYNIVNGQPSDSNYHAFLDCYNVGTTSGLRILFDYRASHGIDFIMFWSGGYIILSDLTSDWSAGDKVHLMFVWDKNTGFDGSKTMAIYVNGVQTASTTSAITATVNWNSSLTFLTYQDGSYPFDGSIDNLKIFNDASIISKISANRFYESFGNQKIRSL